MLRSNCPSRVSNTAPPPFSPAQSTLPADNSNVPLLIEADRFDREDNGRILSAYGNVEVIHPPYVLRADEAHFDTVAKRISAKGNVVLLDKDNSVYFAESGELSTALDSGQLDYVRSLMADDVRFTSPSVRKIDADTTVADNATYTPCKICATDLTPFWQLRAKTITRDEKSLNVKYDNAWMEIGSVPVFYTPYLSHPDPTVDRRSGFLAPKAGYDSTLGGIAGTAYYFDIAPDRDATLELTQTTKQGSVVGGQYRQRFLYGEIDARGSFTVSDRNELVTNSNGTSLSEQNSTPRGHLFVDGKYDISDNWRGIASIRTSSDDDYLEQYDISSDDVLVNTIYTEGFFDRAYIRADVQDVQDNRGRATEEQPILLPYVTLSASSEPDAFLGGQLFTESSHVNILRTPGQDLVRTSAGGGWRKNYVDSSGLVSDMEVFSRLDGYYIQDSNTVNPSATTATLRSDDSFGRARAFGYANFQTRYPLLASVGKANVIFEPIASATYAPNTLGDDDVPNEDSRSVELDQNNLFRANRISGVDRIEDYSTVSYGLQTRLLDSGLSKLFLGQSYRLSERGGFEQSTGLKNQLSAVVVQTQITPNDYFDLDYRGRFDADDSWSPLLQEIALTTGVRQFTFTTSYLQSDADPLADITEAREQIRAGVSSWFTDNWFAFVGAQYDLTSDTSPLNGAGQLRYLNDCFDFITSLSRDFTDDPNDNLSETRVLFQVSFKGLGTFTTPDLSDALQLNSTEDSGN